MSLSVKAVQDTTFKALPRQSADLPDDQKFAVQKGSELKIAWYKKVGNHVTFQLETPVNGRFSWFGFERHIQIIEDGRVKEDFADKPPYSKTPPFWNQLDNYRDPHRTCNCSATAMALKKLGANIVSDDEFVERVFRYGDTTDHSVVDMVCEKYYGIKTAFTYTATFGDLDRKLKTVGVVVLGILHRGSIFSPYGGHMITVFDKEGGNYVCHDPYGSLMNGYTGPATDGRAVRYSKQQFEARWAPNVSDGWMRTFGP